MTNDASFDLWRASAIKNNPCKFIDVFILA